VKELNSYLIEDFANKVFAARKSNQKSVTLDIKEAQLLVETLTIVLSRAVGNLERANTTEPQETVTSVQMDGGSF
jgi:hypothetical protein